MTYKEIITNPWYASIIVFVTQVIFLYLRTLNVIYTSNRNMWGTILTGNGVSLFWLVSMSIGMNSMLTGSWQPIIAFILGGTLGTYYGIKKENKT
jgi:hypothetical protein